MSSVVIRNLSPELHKRLKQAAESNHRSMNKQIIVLLEQGLNCASVSFAFPEPVKAKKQLTQAFLDKAIKEGRE